MRQIILTTAAALLIVSASAQAQVVTQARGVDSRVDYAKLTEIGPWDDRNYQLTQADLALLAPNERELRDPIPAFYRVLVRKHAPDLPTTGPAQYPRSALNVFRMMYGGYLVDGKLYRGATVIDGRFLVQAADGVSYQEWAASGRDEELFERGIVLGEVRVTNPNGAAESAVSINPVNVDLVIAGSNGPSSGQTMHRSSNGGTTWSQSTALPLGGTCCDPAVEWSSDGTQAYTATLGNCGFSGCSVWFYRSADNGATWTGLESDTPGDPRRELTSAGASDKEYLHVDRSSSSPHLDNLYMTWHDNNILKFARSTDHGNTWSANLTISGAGQNGIGSDITTDKLGNVYYFWPSFQAPFSIYVKKSTDGGANFGSSVQVSPTNAEFDYPVPSMESRRVFIYLAADADLSDGPFAGSVYVAWNDTNGPESGSPANNHAKVQVAYSRDAGATWTVVTPHPTADINTVDRYNQWLSVSPDGTVHVIYYDTQRDATRQSVDLFHAYSTDGGVNWTQERLTSVQSPNITDSFEWGDYNGMDARQASVMAIYTDNRDENGGSAQSIDVYAIGLQNVNAVFADGFETGDTSLWTATVP